MNLFYKKLFENTSHAVDIVYSCNLYVTMVIPLNVITQSENHDGYHSESECLLYYFDIYNYFKFVLSVNYLKWNYKVSLNILLVTL